VSARAARPARAVRAGSLRLFAGHGGPGALGLPGLPAAAPVGRVRVRPVDGAAVTDAVSEAVRPQDGVARRALWPGLGLVAGAGVLVLVLARPSLDGHWENHAGHFWLVLSAAALNVVLGYAVGSAARRRRDARLLLVSLAFVAAAGFLGLHALATPGVLIGKNAGFELATPIGLALAGLFAAASSLPLRPAAAEHVLRRSRALVAALVAVMAVWATVSLAELAPLAGELSGEELNGWQLSLAAVGVVLYAVAAAGYFRLYQRRRSLFLLSVVFAFALLTEAMLAIAWARNWHLSWWEWHLLMLGAFAAIAASARSEWHEERFSPPCTSTRRSRTRARSAFSSPIFRASRRLQNGRARTGRRRC
jgi:hypothetical protein